jgi:hypothetical protein
MPEKVNITLDRPSGVYFAGERVSGKVKIHDNSRNGAFYVSFPNEIIQSLSRETYLIKLFTHTI